MKRTQKILAAVAALVVGSVGISNAQAALQVTLESGLFTQTYVDGVDDAVADGVLNVTSTSINGLAFTGNLAYSNSPGSASQGILQITTITIKNQAAGAATLKITTSDTNYTLPGSPGDTLKLDSAVGGTFLGTTAGDVATFVSFADPANGQPASAVATPMSTYISTGPALQNFSQGSSTNFTRGAGNFYSLANTLTVTLSPLGQANISGTTTTTLIPEPSVLGLVAAAAPLALRRRRMA